MIKKDFLLLGIGRVFQAAIALISLRLMTTYLPTNEVGYTYLILAIGSYFGLVFINPVGMYFNRHIHELQKKFALGSFLEAMNLYFFGVGIISLPIVFILQSVLKIGTEISFLELSTLIFLTAYGSTWFQTLCPSLNMLNKRTHYIVINNIAIGLGLAFSILGITFFKTTAFVWVLGSLLGQIVGALVALLYMKKFFLNSPSPQTSSNILFRKDVWFFCFPVAIATLLMWFQTQSYRLVVENLLGAETLASLGVGLGVAASLCALTESIASQYYYPQYYSKISTATSEERAQAWEIFFKNSLIIYILMAATIISCARPILNILVAPEYHSLSMIVVLGVVNELVRILTNIVYAVSHSEMKTKESILPYAAGGIIAFTGTLLAIQYNSESIAFSLPFILILSSSICFLVMWFKMSRLLTLRISPRSLVLTFLLALPLFVAYKLTENIESFAESMAACLIAAAYTLGTLWVMRNNFTEFQMAAGGAK